MVALGDELEVSGRRDVGVSAEDLERIDDEPSAGEGSGRPEVVTSPVVADELEIGLVLGERPVLEVEGIQEQLPTLVEPRPVEVMTGQGLHEDAERLGPGLRREVLDRPIEQGDGRLLGRVHPQGRQGGVRDHLGGDFQGVLAEPDLDLIEERRGGFGVAGCEFELGLEHHPR